MPLRQRAFLGRAGGHVSTPVSMIRAASTPATVSYAGPGTLLAGAGGLAELASLPALGGWIAQRHSREAARPWKHAFWWLLVTGAAAQIGGDLLAARTPLT